MSLTLEEIRKQIDTVDDDILRLLDQRSSLVHEVGVIKKRDGLEIYAPEREDALLQSLAKKNRAIGGRLPDKSVWAIYREIMSAALALEQDLKIAYLGPPGTWTHQAALNKFGQSVKYVPMASFHDVFDEVARRRADYGVVPIENSTEGAVNHTLDLFADSSLNICAQILLRIDNALLSNCPKDEIEVIYSHPQVFGQCRGWLQKHFPKVPTIDCSSTTKAAEMAAKNPKAAALGGELAGQLSGLTVMERSIQDSATNTTRFMVLSEQTCPPTGNDRTSLMFSVHNEPGSLYRALAPFSDSAVNMSKIESRPSKRRPWEYFFFVDLLGHQQDASMITALQELSKHCSMVKILGSYPNNEETAQARALSASQLV